MPCDKTSLVGAPPFRLRHHPEPAVIVLCLTTIALSLDYAFAPALSNVTPALSCAFLLALIVRHLSSNPASAPSDGDSPIERQRVVLFIGLHLAAIGTAQTWSHLGIVFDRSSLPSTAVAAARYLIVLPTIVLLPWKSWRRFGQSYRAEWIAALIALLTFYPYRVFAMAWPWYSSILARLVLAFAHPFVAGLHYIGASSPTLSGPMLDTTIIFDCGGLQGVKLFQLLFALVLILDWNVVNRCRACVGYLAGIAMILFSNAARIALLVIIGNRVSADLVVSKHLAGSWIFAALVLIAYLLVVYRWFLKGPTTSRRRQLRPSAQQAG